MTPSQALELIIAVTCCAYVLERIRRRRSQSTLRDLAAEWRMNFGHEDTLRLTPRIARYFPIPGAADLRVSNVIYGVHSEGYRYIFTAEYTLGVMRARRRFRSAATFAEPRHHERGDSASPVVLSPAGMPLIDQYRYLAPLMNVNGDSSSHRTI